MHFALTEEQVELTRSVRGLVERQAGQVDVRAALASEAGYDTVLWDSLCNQIGVAALAIPEEYGGVGFSTFETHLVLETLGASLSPSPLLGSAVLAARAVLLAGNAADCTRLLPGIADGTSVVALAWADADGRWRRDGSDVRAQHADERWRLTGTATLVLDGAGADVLLVVANTDDGPAIFQVDPTVAGVVRTATPGLDLTLPFAHLDLTDVGAHRLDGPMDVPTVLETLFAEAAVAVSALQVGGAQSALDRTVAHLKQREQFGRSLGSFQALKHRVADMLVAVESARSVSWSAAWAASQGTDDLSTQAATAKAWCSEAFSAVTSEMVQLHGGIAITWEHDAHLYFKRAHATAQMFGTAREHRAHLLRDRP